LLKKDLADIFKKYKSDTQIYHDLMHFRVREILLVTTLYDAFILEQEDQLTEEIFGEYHSLDLPNAPRITSASYGEEALELIGSRHFDIVILTMRISDMTPFELSQKIKSAVTNMPVFLLLHDNNDLMLLGDKRDRLPDIDKIFVWNRDSKIFLAMIKYIEDKINVVNDTELGLVRVILLVENSIRYYSRYLPILYNEIMIQTQRLIEEEHSDEMKKMLRMNARPKVLMAVNYEEAVSIFERYKDYLICVISDVKFPRNNKSDEHAGIELIKYVKQQYQDLPMLLQSSDQDNAALAAKYNSHFLNKNSESLASDLRDFVLNNLGFGDFIFRDARSDAFERAATMNEFKKLLKQIPYESLFFHANRNHFSAWLMARGEIRIAKKIQPVKVTDFRDAQELRNYLIDIFENVDYQNLKGRVLDFDETVDEAIIHSENFLIKLADGSFGGKGRGLAFINTAIQNIDFTVLFPDVSIMIPKTAVIGTEEYEDFLENNDLDRCYNSDMDFEELKKCFLNGKLSESLTGKLRVYLKHIHKPLAVRSSGLFEDSVSESFSGVYQTFLIPNNHPSLDVRLQQLENAIKLVYASVFSRLSRSYFEAINYKVEEEKMAVLIQEVVGNQYDNRYYPDFSGVAQSYNYYPISYMKPEDGVTVVAVGLGKYVIDGEKTFRFSPKYPRLDILPPDTQLKNTQDFFYAIDMTKNDINLIEGEDITLSALSISEAEKDGRLDQLASVWDAHDGTLNAGLRKKGPRLINFAPILKLNTFPLPKILLNILDIVRNSMGTPVEIEFAVDMGKEEEDNFVHYGDMQGSKSHHDIKPSFYILQLKPLIREYQEFNLEPTDIDKEKLFLYTEKGMGNGKIEDVFDVIYCDPDKFDKSKTEQMVTELEELNKMMVHEKRKYILIGPGRWGTRDRWLGIPVAWAQISNAKIIVEAGLKDFQIDASLGSHFFHNITSMNIGYFNVPYDSGAGFIDWNWLKSRKPNTGSDHFVHVNFGNPLIVLMDGRKSVSMIYKA
jgi:CheY-like chemotaxis protein